MSFRPYVEHGWKLCPIHEGAKRPRGDQWNDPARALTAERAAQVTSAGLMHKYSGTCALDLDNVDLTRAYLAARGIDLDVLLNAPDSVHISSGTENRGKLLFALPEPLPTKRVTRKIDDGKGKPTTITLFELRCATADAKSMQDLLPPSPHPSGRHYEWRYGDELTGDWRQLPPLPSELHALWLKLLGPRSTESTPVPAVQDADDAPTDPALVAQARAILAKHDPDTDYDTWIKLGMALDADLGETGWQMWHEWSAKGKKYPGEQQLATHWQSFGKSPNPVTLGTFLREQVASVDDFDEVSVAETQERAARFKPIAAGEWAAKFKAAVLWLVRLVIPRAELIVVYGASGSGKSFWLLDVLAHIVLGRAWRALRVSKGRVVYICAEGATGARARLRALEQKFGPMDGLFIIPNAPDMLGDDDTPALIEAIRASGEPPVAIAIDTLSRVHAGNENSGEDMGRVVKNCQRVHRAFDCVVVLVHHSGKDEARGARGWSGIRAAVDTEIEITKIGEGPSATHNAHIAKQKDGEDGADYPFKLVCVELGTNDDGDHISSCTVEPMDHMPAVAAGGSGVKLDSLRPNQRIAYQAALDHLNLADRADVAGAIQLAADRMAPPAEGEKDRRKARAREGFEALSVPAKGRGQLIWINGSEYRMTDQDTGFEDVTSTDVEAA